jgi:hypothetical protein
LTTAGVVIEAAVLAAIGVARAQRTAPYTPGEAYALLTAWGPAGRRGQVGFTLTIDVLLPLAMFAFTALALRYAGARLHAPRWLPVTARSLITGRARLRLLHGALTGASIGGHLPGSAWTAMRVGMS